MSERVYTDLHFFCGIGGTKIGTAKARAVAGGESARFEAIGGIDIDPQACRDYERMTGAPALCADVHLLQPAELRRFAGDRRPDFVASSSPCTGFSRLLPEVRSREPHYQSLNELFTRSLFLCVSTWDEPPPLMFWENVPGIMSRGAKMVADAIAMLQAHGYAVDVGNHDCGEIGGLAQRRPRWFMVARHRSRMPHVVYLPRKKRVRACGEVIGPMPMPGDTDAGGAMHALPNLSWKNWKRLAAIPAGGDWRDLGGVVPSGKKRREVHRRHSVLDFGEPTPAITGPGGHAAEAVADPRPFHNRMPLIPWDQPAKSVIGALQIGSGSLSVSDARFGHVERVTPWDAATGTITHAPAPSSGAVAVADPRWGGGRLRVDSFDAAAPTVTGNSRADGSGAANIADPRFSAGKKKNWQQVAGITPWTEPLMPITSSAGIHAGAFQVADPRLLAFTCSPRAGAYRVLRWDQAADTVTGALGIDNGPAAVADPRVPGFRWATAEEIAAAEANPKKPPPFIPIIIAPDDTWHRPLTTYELAALQSYPLVGPDGRPTVLDGISHTRWRKAIGNLVPPDSAEASAEQFLLALLRSDLGMFTLSAEPIWVAPQPEYAA
jgi:site-specific DNA-cytosine methylase